MRTRATLAAPLTTVLVCWPIASSWAGDLDEGGASRPPSSSPIDQGGASRPPSSSPIDQGGPSRPPSSSTDADRARAAARFEEAKSDMGRGDFVSACPKLAESQGLDPQVGTLLNLAYCYENSGKTATALSTWMEAASFAAEKKQQDREQFALDRARWLEPHLLRVVIRVAPQPVYDRIALTVDGAPFERSRWGVPTPMDTGEHELRADAPGRTSWSSRYSVEEGHVPSILIPVLAPIEAPAPQSGHAVVSSGLERPGADSSGRRSARAGHVLSPYALVAGGIGVAAVAVGAGFGIAGLVNVNEASSDRNCLPSACDAHEAENTRAKHDATAADVSFALAAVAGVTGFVLWFATGTGHESLGHVSLQAGAASGSGTVVLSGRW